MKRNKKIAKTLASLLLCITALTCTFSMVACADEVQVTQSVADNTEAAVQSGEASNNNTTADTQSNKKQVESVEIVDRSVPFLRFLYDFFAKVLLWLYEHICHNYIIAILLLALLIKIVLFPLSIKQQKNSQKMAKLAPRQEAIRKKYAGRTDQKSQMKMNEEIQQLMADEKYNPMSGCLPTLLQLPVILALYNAITAPMKSFLGYSADKLSELSSLFTANISHFEGIGSQIIETDAISLIASTTNPEVISSFGEHYTKIKTFYDTFQFGPINLMDNPEVVSWLVIVPILVFFSSVFSSKIIRKFTYNPNMGAQQDMSMKIMDWTMPLMILFFCFQVPALVGLYWVFQNVISIGQQYILFKLFPVKAPTEAEIREAELLMRGKKVKKADYVDDDDNAGKKPAQLPKTALKKKKANSPFIYAKKGIKPSYLLHIKEVGKAPVAKKRP